MHFVYLLFLFVQRAPHSAPPPHRHSPLLYREPHPPPYWRTIHTYLLLLQRVTPLHLSPAHQPHLLFPHSFCPSPHAPTCLTPSRSRQHLPDCRPPPITPSVYKNKRRRNCGIFSIPACNHPTSIATVPALYWRRHVRAGTCPIAVRPHNTVSL